jgi:Cu-Zn family superoxide dismutase
MANSRIFFVAVVSAIALTPACQQAQQSTASNDLAEANDMIMMNKAMPGSAMPNARLIDASGKVIGHVEMSEDSTGVTLRLTAEGLPQGTHGVHLHEKGICDPPFASAGAHWNPTSKEHGRDNLKGAHLGDLDNVDVAAGSDLGKTFTISGVSVGGDENQLADADGTSLVIHAKADDYKTDPSGNSGDRIACAVLATHP